MKKPKFIAIAACLIGAGLVIEIGSLVLFLVKTTRLDVSLPIDPQIFANYGALVGGVVGSLFSLAGVFLLIQNLSEQRQNFLREQIESRFFKLVEIHRQNETGISIKDRIGRKVFIILLREYYACRDALRPLQNEFQLSELETINAAYLAFYYGAVGASSEAMLRKRLAIKHGDKFIDQLIATLRTASQRPRLEGGEEKDDNEGDAATGTQTFYYKPFDGHQSRLGHYFRHLFQTVKYINQQPSSLLNYNDKYRYIKTLRAQFSTHEQVLLLLNSLSDLGLAWERDPAIQDVNSKLITKYNLIKNIPNGFVRNIEFRHYYPDIEYEGDLSPPARRGGLVEMYQSELSSE